MDAKEKDILSQEEHISLLQKRKKGTVKAEGERINEAYRRCVEGDEDAFTELIEGLDKMYSGLVRRSLLETGCYDEENEHFALQEARLDIWLRIQRVRKEKIELNVPFAAYCRGIYRNKAYDIIREILDKQTYQKDNGIREMSFNEEQKEDRHTLAETSADPQYEGNRVDVIFANMDNSQLCGKLVETYCYAMTQTKADPTGSLALYYCRVLPHVLQTYYGIKTIPDGKATSPSWAIKKMGDKTVGTLGTESEEGLKTYISPELFWGDAFWDRMGRSVKTSAGMQVMKEIVYTAEFSEKEIGHMENYMHEKVALEWVKLVKKDSKLMASAIEYAIDPVYAVKKNKMLKLLKGGMEK